MKKVLFFILLALLCAEHLFSQVRVRGYYRKNGTYVAPHYRSSPDGNPYNNWSYPGNTNPYTGKVASGDPTTYLNNYYNRESNGSSSTRQYPQPYTGSSNSFSDTKVLYTTHFVDLPFSPPLRNGPGLEYDEIYKCPLGSEIYVLESGGTFCKVIIDYHTGYISSQLLRAKTTAVMNTSRKPEKKYDVSSGSGILYKTYVIGDLPFNASLREGPGIQYREIHQCEPNTTVYVLDLGKVFYKVIVNGHVGYISGSLLR